MGLKLTDLLSALIWVVPIPIQYKWLVFIGYEKEKNKVGGLGCLLQWVRARRYLGFRIWEGGKW